MTIIEALVRLRNDLKLWVANNLRMKVDKEDGKGLSSNDFTTEEKEKLGGLSTDGLATVTYVDEELSKKANSDHIHEQYVESSDIEGFATTEYVDTQLEVKANTNHTHEEYLIADDISNKADISYVDEELDAAIAEAKEDASNKDAVVLYETQKSIEVIQTALDTHTSKTDIHITSDERTAWNAKADKTYVDMELDAKADRATTLEGYGITDAASKEYVDTILEGLTTEGTADAALVQAALTAHTNDKANPHAVTLSQLGVDATYAELNCVMGATSNIQTQLDNKQNVITGAATTIASDNLIASRVLISDSSGKVGTHAVSATELAHLLGVTSNVQTQLNAKADSSALSDYYTKTEIDNMELITVEDIDAICGATIQ